MTDLPSNPFPQLTSRERLVAMGLVVGKTNRELADELGISIKTIDTHRTNLMKRLQCKNNVSLCLLAVRRGWIVV